MTIAKADYIEGLAKGLSVLEAFDTERQRLNATLAAQRTGITRAAARRHLLTLAELGYLETDGSYFWLSSKVLRFSSPSQMSPQGWSTMRPVRAPQVGPLSTSSTLERVQLMPNRSRTWSVKKVKPPCDTSFNKTVRVVIASAPLLSVPRVDKTIAFASTIYELSAAS